MRSNFPSRFENVAGPEQLRSIEMARAFAIRSLSSQPMFLVSPGGLLNSSQLNTDLLEQAVKVHFNSAHCDVTIVNFFNCLSASVGKKGVDFKIKGN